MKTVVGLYDELEDAREAVDELVEAGVPRSDISLVARDVSGEYGSYMDTHDNGEEVTDAAAGGAVGGAVVGGLMGLLVGLGAFAIPGLGPVIAAGPLAALLTGAGIGAATGGVLGALVEWGIPEAEADYYAEGLRRGGTLLAVRVAESQVEDVVEIMNDYDPVNIERRAEYWREENGWETYDPNAEPYGAEEIASYRRSMNDWDDTDDDDAFDLDDELLEDDLDVADMDLEDESNYLTRAQRPSQIHTYGGESYHAETGAPVQGHVKRTDEDQANQTFHAETGAPVQGHVKRSDEGLDGDTSHPTWEELERNYRQNYDTMYATAGSYTWNQYSPAYRYGYNLATDSRYADRDWAGIEADARRQWELENQGTWEAFKDAVRYGWQQVQDALGVGDYDFGVEDRSDEHMHH